MILILILVSGCSSSKKEEKASLEAGPPTRPLFYEYEGLKWGMTKEEVKSVWGAGVEKNIVTLSYTDKGGYKKVEALFKSVPASSNIQTVAGKKRFLNLLFTLRFNSSSIFNLISLILVISSKIFRINSSNGCFLFLPRVSTPVVGID